MFLSMSETSLSFVSSIIPSSTANTIIGASILTTATALLIHHISPTRLTPVLVALMHETDATYIGAIEAGVIRCDVDTEAMSKLQIKVSQLHEESLQNSLSTRKMLAEFLRGRSLSLYRGIRDVQDLKTQIEEEQLRNLNPMGAGTAAWTMFARGGTFILRAPGATVDASSSFCDPPNDNGCLIVVYLLRCFRTAFLGVYLRACVLSAYLMYPKSPRQPLVAHQILYHAAGLAAQIEWRGFYVMKS
ncbi:hypothetical protein C8J57DRAFT_1237969 [Mycena rebaudengoi]|nr:hypothetical protein C8J57DRAFT_1237969 [Mycena rebaudengoi]